MSGDKAKVRKALTEARATELQSRMAWILFGIRGAANALEFISKIAKANEGQARTGGVV